MIKSVSSFITQYLRTNNASLTEKDTLKIQYTIEVILGDLSKFIIIFVIFSMLKEIPLFLLSFIILNSTRPLLGGLHCKTYYSCLMFSTLYFLIIFLLSNLAPKLNIIFYIIFFAIYFIITIASAPCRNEKRPIKNKAVLKILSLISLTLWCILFFKISNTKICNCIFLSIFFQITQVTIVTLKGGDFNEKIYKLFFSHTT